MDDFSDGRSRLPQLPENKNRATPNQKAWESDSCRASKLTLQSFGEPTESSARVEPSNRADLFWKQWVGTCSTMLDDVQARLQQQEKLIEGFINYGRRRSSADKKSEPIAKIRSAAQAKDEEAPFASPFDPSSNVPVNSWVRGESQVEEILLTSSDQAKTESIPCSTDRDSASVILAIKSRTGRTPVEATSNQKLFAESGTVSYDNHVSQGDSWTCLDDVSQEGRHKIDPQPLEAALKRSQSTFAKDLEHRMHSDIHDSDPSTCVGKLLFKIEEVQVWLQEVKTSEPERTGCLAAWVKGTIFSTTLSTVIFLDSLYTALASNRLMEHPNSNSTTAMKIIETIFVAIYFMELVLKLLVHGWYFFVNSDMRWNWFDFLLVVQALVDLVMEYALQVQSANVTFIRLIRLVKLVKILRLFKAVRFLRELRVMMVSIMNCLTALFWAFMMLALILYIFALFVVQNTSGYLAAEEGNIADDQMLGIEKFYSTVQSTIMTLYQSSCGGLDWREAYDIAARTGALNAAGFIFFTIFFNFAVFNILSGIFIEKALAATQPDREQQALEQRRVEEQEAHELTKLLQSMDFAGTGRINLKDFMTHSMQPDAKAYLRVLGIEVHDAVMFFKVLTKVLGADELPIEEFVNRLFKMKGTATALDLQGLSFEVTVIHKMLEEIAGLVGVQTRIPRRIYTASNSGEAMKPL